MISVKSSGIYDLADLGKDAYNEHTSTIKIPIYNTKTSLQYSVSHKIFKNKNADERIE